MKCPVCHDVRMREVDKNGILIDVCPDCKGVWLDRGELEKLTEGMREVRQSYEQWSGRRDHDDDDDYKKQTRHDDYNRSGDYGYNNQNNYDEQQGKYGYGKHKKKKTVFDVFDDLF